MFLLIFALVLVTRDFRYNFEIIFYVKIPAKILVEEATCNLLFVRDVLQRFEVACWKQRKNAENYAAINVMPEKGGDHRTRWRL